MPLEVQDVDWSENEQFLTLKVPLKGASRNNVDIFSTNTYIKVSYPPYFYEVALCHEIDDDASKATISNGQVIFHLRKCVNELWGQLHASEFKDKIFMKNLRSNALEYKQKKEKEKTEKISKERDQQKKFAVREQMRLDNEERKQIEDKKQEIEAKHIKDMEKWKRENSRAKMTSEKQQVIHPAENKNEVCQENVHDCEDKEKEVPEPRTYGNIQVNFSARQLPTPARESKLPEEEVWLKKLAEMNKMKKTHEDATDIEEMNPIWLKDKGDEFFKKGNFVAAINAYTSALILDSKVPMLYSNRAACHLAMKQYNETIQDCTCALELYDPPVPANSVSRCRALIRRGTAQFYLNNYVEALVDYDAAVKLDPKNDALKIDAYKIRRVIQGEESSDY